MCCDPTGLDKTVRQHNGERRAYSRVRGLLFFSFSEFCCPMHAFQLIIFSQIYFRKAFRSVPPTSLRSLEPQRRDAKTGVSESHLPFLLDEGTSGRNVRSDLYRQVFVCHFGVWKCQ